MPRKGKKSKLCDKPNETLLFDSSSSCLKCLRGVYLGENFDRWCQIRSKLSFCNDDAFVKYLLDSVESEIKSNRVDDEDPKERVPETVESISVTKPPKRHKSQQSLPQNTKKNHVTTTRNCLGVVGKLDEQSTDLKDGRDKLDRITDEEKENVRLDANTNNLCAEDEGCVNKVEGTSVLSREIVNTSGNENSIILKETEQNKDYTKLKKHKKRKNSDKIIDFSSANLKACIKQKKFNSMGSRKKEDNTSDDAHSLINEPDSVTSLNVCDVEPSDHQQECLQKDVADDQSFESAADLSVENQSPLNDQETVECSDCDSRHLENSCPIRCPQKIVSDSVNWEQFSKESPVVVQSSRDEDDSQSAAATCDRQSFAFLSLPDCLELRVCDPEHGLSVVARQPLLAFTRFGPLVGRPLKQMDIPDDCSMKGMWEMMVDGKCVYVSTQNADTCNWVRWLRPAATREQRNVAAVEANCKLYFVTTMPLLEGDELLYWTDALSAQHQAWFSNKMTKTNCGGCNLQFAHPIYYHRHCAVFHDPNFSLTIRKYHCKICGLSVLGKENIMKHAASSHDGKGAYQCQFCKKFFLRLNYLEMHRTYGCSLNPHRTRPLCDYCGRKFCQPQKLKIHIKRMHSEISEVLKEFQCKRCLKILGSRAALQRHIKEVHHKAILCSCTCDKCGKMFQNKSNLKIHMLTHSGIKPFKCQQNGCSAAFTTKQCLQFHYKKVHGLADNKMPRIERSVAYTFDAYAGEMRPNSADSCCSSPESNRLAIDDGEIDEQQVDIEQQPNDYRQYSSPPSVGEHEGIAVGYDERMEPCEERDDEWAEEEEEEDEEEEVGVDSVEESSQSRVQEFYRFGGEVRSSESANSDQPVAMVVAAPKPESSNASLLVEAALDAAEKDIEMSFRVNKMSPDPLFPILHGNIDRMSPLPRQLPPKSISPDYTMHHTDLSASVRNIDPAPALFASPSSPALRPHPGYNLMFPERLSHFELHLSPSVAPIEPFHGVHDEPRYDTSTQRRPDDYSSGDDNDNAVQNLSVGLKSKSSLQLDIHAGYKYDAVEERSDNFECVEGGVDMTRSGIYHHSGFVSRYPHALYDQRSYTHSDVLRVVNLTHSIDLSLSRGGNHHHMMDGLRGVSPPPIPYQNYPSPPPAAPYLATGTARSSHSPNIAMYHHFSSY